MVLWGISRWQASFFLIHLQLHPHFTLTPTPQLFTYSDPLPEPKATGVSGLQEIKAYHSFLHSI